MDRVSGGTEVNGSDLAGAPEDASESAILQYALKRLGSQV